MCVYMHLQNDSLIQIPILFPQCGFVVIVKLTNGLGLEEARLLRKL